MRSPRGRPFDARLAARLFKLQAMVIAAFAGGSLTAGVINLGGLALVYAARHVHARRRPAHAIAACPAVKTPVPQGRCFAPKV
jgi:hypothetical protein